MKKIYILIITSSFVLSGCGIYMFDIKKSIYLVDAPADLEITLNKKKVEIEDVFIEPFDYVKCNDIKFKYPGIKSKLKRNNKLELKSDGKKATLKIKQKRQIGLLLLELPMGFGTFTIIDLITGADGKPDLQFIDVPAVMEKKKKRGQKELHKTAYDNFAWQKKPEEYYLMGIEKCQNKDYSGALKDLDVAAKLEPENIAVYTNRGNVKKLLNDNKGALADFDKAVELDSVNLIALKGRGDIKFVLKDYLGAIEDYNKAIEADLYNRWIFYQRENSKILLKENEGAPSVWKETLESRIAEAELKIKQNLN